MEPICMEAVVSQLGIHHARQASLCNMLEDLADGLPSDVDNQRCLTLARQIVPTVHQAHQFEEQTLFPLLQSLSPDNEELGQSVERLRFEHWEDESFAEDLSEALRHYGSGSERRDSEKLSYMLRGFFEGLRRHIAFEAEHLLPMLRAGLTSPSQTLS